MVATVSGHQKPTAGYQLVSVQGFRHELKHPPLLPRVHCHLCCRHGGKVGKGTRGGSGEDAEEQGQSALRALIAAPGV